MPVSQAPRQPRNVLYIIRATQSDRDAEVAEIKAATRISIDPDRDILFVAPPSELRDKPATRPGFRRVMAELQPYDLLVVTRLNRLGRTTAEVLDTVKQLEWKNVHLRCLELGDHRAGLTRIAGGISEHGTLIMQTMAACVKLECEERDRRRNARTKTKRQGRPPALKTEHKRREAVERCQVPGATVTGVAGAMGVSRPTIYRAFQAAFGPAYHEKLAARRAAIAYARSSFR